MTTLTDLKRTPSYQSGLITVEEFDKPPCLPIPWGAKKTRPDKIEVDKTKQRILLQKITEGQVTDKLVNPKFFPDSPVPIKADNQTDNLIVVSVKTTTLSLVITSPTQNRYIFRDQIAVDVGVTVSFRATDCEKLWPIWDNGGDPLAILTSRIRERAKSYFASIDLSNLIEPVDLFEVRTNVILQLAAQKAVTKLKELLKKTQVDGLSLADDIDIDVDVVISANQPTKPIDERLEELKKAFQITPEILDHMHLIEAGVMRRQGVEALLDKDMRFKPFTLRQIIMRVDPLLLDEFYAGRWDDGIEALNEKIKAAKDNRLQDDLFRASVELQKATSGQPSLPGA